MECKKNKVLNCRGENGCGGAAVCIVFRNRDKFRKSVPGESAAVVFEGNVI